VGMQPEVTLVAAHLAMKRLQKFSLLVTFLAYHTKSTGMRETILEIILFKCKSTTKKGCWMEEITVGECPSIEKLYNLRKQAKTVASRAT
jgi:hypothetical protein